MEDMTRVTMLEAELELARSRNRDMENVLLMIQEKIVKLTRGCSCDYDYRCSSCHSVVDIKESIIWIDALLGKK